MTGQLVSRNNKTIHAISEPIAGGGFKTTPYFDCSGFNEIALTLQNVGNYSTNANIVWSHDGLSAHGEDTEIFPPSTNRRRAVSTPIKAKYFNLNVTNSDATERVINVWAYLKS